MELHRPLLFLALCLTLGNPTSAQGSARGPESRAGSLRPTGQPVRQASKASQVPGDLRRSSGALTAVARGCAPSGTAAPILAVHRAGPGRLLRLQNGPPFGRAVLLVEGPHMPGTGPARPMLPGCLARVRGHMLTYLQLDAAGEFELPLSPGALLARPTVSAVVIPAGAALGQAALSNRLVLGPVHDRDAVGVGGGGAGMPSIVFTEYMKDPAAVSDAAGEWIELYNPGDSAVDIEGWVLSDLGSDSVVLDNQGLGIVVPAGGFLVLGKNGDTSTNGGVDVDFEWSGTTLSNGDDELILSLPNGRLVDAVEFDGGTLWPDEAGRSASLQNGAFDSVSNDDPANWCLSTTPLSPSNPDTGTPGLANDSCMGG